MNIPVLTLVHISASITALLAGLIALGRLLEGRTNGASTRLFLGATVATVVTGFLFSLDKFTPAIAVGILCVPLLSVVGVALYVGHLAGRWLPTYTVGAVSLVYLNTLVLAAQLLMKVPALKEIAPSERSPVFVGVQLAILVAFGFLGRTLLNSMRRASSKERP